LSVSPELYEAIVRIVDQRVGEIKVTREDFDNLTRTVSELSGTVREFLEAQKRTELNLSKLGERTIRLEGALDRLAEAQKRTEDAVGRLAVAVGGLSDTVGYGPEDVARVMLPAWLEKHERVRVEEFERRFIKVDAETVEINLYSEGLKGRRPTTIVGEAKSRIHAGDVKEFAGKIERIGKAMKGRSIVPLMFGYWIHPAASALGRNLRIRVIASYQR